MDSRCKSEGTQSSGNDGTGGDTVGKGHTFNSHNSLVNGQFNVLNSG